MNEREADGDAGEPRPAETDVAGVPASGDRSDEDGSRDGAAGDEVGTSRRPPMWGAVTNDGAALPPSPLRVAAFAWSGERRTVDPAAVDGGDVPSVALPAEGPTVASGDSVESGDDATGVDGDTEVGVEVEVETETETDVDDNGREATEPVGVGVDVDVDDAAAEQHAAEHPEAAAPAPAVGEPVPGPVPGSIAEASSELGDLAGAFGPSESADLDEQTPEHVPADRPDRSGADSSVVQDPVDDTGTDPEGTAADQGVDATDPSADATDPSADATDPSADATDPSADATDPSVDATVTAVDATDQRADATDPETDATGEGPDATDQTNEDADATDQVVVFTWRPVDPDASGRDADALRVPVGHVVERIPRTPTVSPTVSSETAQSSAVDERKNGAQGDEATATESPADLAGRDVPGANAPAADRPSPVGPEADESSTEVPSADEPSTDEASADEPNVDEASADEPNVDEASADEPNVDEASADEPNVDDASADEPTRPSTPPLLVPSQLATTTEPTSAAEPGVAAIDGPFSFADWIGDAEDGDDGTAAAGPRPASATGAASTARRSRSPRAGAREPRHVVARHGVLPSVTRLRTVANALAFVLVLAIATTTTIGAIVYARTLGSVETVADPVAAPADPVTIEGGANILIVGSDDRTGQGAEYGEGEGDAEGVLNDVNMVVHVAEDQSSISVVSIPRDTIVDTPACINDQGVQVEEQWGVPFNSILQTGGLGCVREAAEQLSGLEIQYAGMVQFRGVIAISNAIGGVKVCVANEIYDEYVNLYMKPGEYTIKGEDALKFLRTRHGVGDGSDLSRIANQQMFLSALLQQVKSTDTLTNPAKLYGIATAITQNMTLTSSLANLDTLLAFARILANVPLDQIRFAQLPVGDSADYAGKVSPLEPAADEMWQQLRDDQPIIVDRGGQPSDGATEPAPDAEQPPADGGAPVPPDDGTGTGDGAPVEPPVETAAPVPTVPGQAADVQGCANQ